MSTSARSGLPPARKGFLEKCKEEPLVPFGVFTTAMILCGGLYSFQRGDRKMGQMFMRARVVAQFGTVAAMIGYAANSGAIDWSQFDWKALGTPSTR